MQNETQMRDRNEVPAIAAGIALFPIGTYLLCTSQQGWSAGGALEIRTAQAVLQKDGRGCVLQSLRLRAKLYRNEHLHCTNSLLIHRQKCIRISCASGCEQQKIFEKSIQQSAVSTQPRRRR